MYFAFLAVNSADLVPCWNARMYFHSFLDLFICEFFFCAKALITSEGGGGFKGGLGIFFVCSNEKIINILLKKNPSAILSL